MDLLSGNQLHGKLENPLSMEVCSWKIHPLNRLFMSEAIRGVGVRCIFFVSCPHLVLDPMHVCHGPELW